MYSNFGEWRFHTYLILLPNCSIYYLKEVLSPTIIVELSISLFNCFYFCFINFGVLLLSTYVFIIPNIISRD